MQPVNIYILTNPESEEVIYVGASMQPKKSIQTRHKLRLGYSVNVDIVDICDSADDAANSEEHWFWLVRSWGFLPSNGIPFKRYQGARSERNKGEFKMPTVYHDFRLSQRAIDFVLSNDEIFTELLLLFGYSNQNRLITLLGKNDWNGRLTIYSCHTKISKVSGLIQGEVLDCEIRQNREKVVTDTQ